jgi:hypothetical protein
MFRDRNTPPQSRFEDSEANPSRSLWWDVIASPINAYAVRAQSGKQAVELLGKEIVLPGRLVHVEPFDEEQQSRLDADHTDEATVQVIPTTAVELPTSDQEVTEEQKQAMQMYLAHFSRGIFSSYVGTEESVDAVTRDRPRPDL